MSRKRTPDRRQDRTRARRPRTVSLSMSDRGQTTQDFAVGIGLFLLAVAFVFLFLPTIGTPYESSGGADRAQADRIADRIVSNLSTETANEIDGSGFNSKYNERNLSTQLGLRASSSDDIVYDRINVSIEEFDGTPVDESELSGGDVYRNQSAASSARIVTIDNWTPADSSDCDPGCRLVVRVW
ncbi:DUF7287 family protein [Natrinema longum]|uniref:Pilin/flagellin n=1 Tax=Natrinema longum TaxID=370324 RepID=A0A8A2UA69_9EURY|nr:hypothetical protein [Natrinema longum]MBZ6493866.1 hypothetical protein [Natrinema longum]QSW84798.1 hypothetical protein J0X27_15300 [Natrinema longum]